MEAEYDEKLKDLRSQYQFELDKKKDLDKELASVKQELEDIEQSFPKEIKSLKD